MNPIRKLSKNVKSLLSASNQVNSFLKAVQELVYNSLDANATSIAVRVHTQEGSIQVVDNGCGINKNDYRVLGHSHFTSKVTDISTLKSMPYTYGYRGQALASIVQVSKCVKITSRSGQSEDTFMKVFEYGREKEMVGIKTRPSVGTTVEIKGFLYHLSIQKKRTSNISNLEEIKHFLQHTSLVQYNISMSLRDDSTNEIVFKIHKNRDIYQTLSSLYDIQRSDVQELQVEKNQYRVTAFIGKNNNDTLKHLVFLNGKLLSDFSKIHKIVTQNLSKYLKMEKTKRRKNKKDFDKEDELKNNVPFYLIFLKCPYNDYDLNTTSNHTIVDFKNWSQISTLLEKLIRFYIGDITIKETDKNSKTIEGNTKNKNTDTRNQVKKIINRILGSKQKMPQVSQMHNGVKGKQATRKTKKKLRNEILSSKSKKPHVSQKLDKHYSPNAFSESKMESLIESPTLNFEIEHNNEVNYEPVPVRKSTVTADVTGNKIKKSYLRKSPILKSKISERKNLGKGIAATKTKKKKIPVKTISLLSKFIDPTDSVQQRYNAFAKVTSNMNNKRTFRESNQRKEVIIEETVEYENMTENRITSVRGKVREVIVQDIFPIPNRTKIFNAKSYESKERRSLLSTSDILNTVLNSQPKQAHVVREKDNLKNNEVNRTQNQEIMSIAQNNNFFYESPTITFQSHNYGHKKIGINYFSHYGDDVFSPVATNFSNVFKKSKAFLSKKSIENFAPPGNMAQLFKRKSYKKNNWLKNTLKKAFNNRHYTRENLENVQCSQEQSSYNIQYSDSDTCKTDYNLNANVCNTLLSSFTTNIEQSMSVYTLNHTPQFIDLSNNQLISNFLFKSDKFLHNVNREFENTVLDSHTGQNINLHCDRLINNGTYTIENSSCNEIEPSINDVGNDNEQVIYATYTVDPKSNTIEKDRNMVACDDDLNIYNIDGCSIKAHNDLISDPIQVCETIMDSHELLNDEFANSFNIRKDSWNILVNKNNSDNVDNLEININDMIDDIDLEQISHHFVTSRLPNQGTATANTMEKQLHFDNNNENYEERDDENIAKLHNVFKFNIEDRLCFLPKGMSQIFKNCKTKAVTGNQSFMEDYYEDRIYNEFAHKVQNTVEIFEPRIQEASDLVTKDIDKVNNKLKKDTASLKFIGESLKHAKVLGQVDQKFIAAVIKGIDEASSELEFLVLFDQHAVHERIRLEANLSDYLTEGQWKSVSLDEVTLKMSSDEIRFLHNFKEKFTQFGLQWIILSSNEISLAAIPEAVLGKNARPVDKIIRAVQSLMKEIINTIKLQSGCVSVYPKSIMELVFSEACRYAIKFGDQLSKTECTELLRNLSECKTPFQCAHGRPVMAVLMDIRPIDVNYKIHVGNIMKFMKVIDSNRVRK